MKKIFVLGFFDCIHIGHRFLFDVAKRDAASDDQIFVTTFDDDFLHSIGRMEEEIYVLAERKEIFNQLGRFQLVVFPSEKTFIEMEKNRFCAFLLHFSPDEIVVGKDYRFGKNAEGDVEYLIKYFVDKNIKVVVSDFLRVNERKVSSREIKEKLYAGEIEEANSLLGESFFYTGIVEEGRKDGRRIGIPTMNIPIDKHKIRIKSGVYVTETEIDGQNYLSVTNVGIHPTFEDDTFNIETHLVDRKIDAYGKRIKIYFYRYIRGIRTFDSKEKLSEQIKNDIVFAKEVERNGKIRSGRQQ